MEYSGDKRKNPSVEIYTLGRFMVRREEITLPRGADRAKKLWELFQFLLINRDRPVSPEEILETLWPEQEYADPNLAVRSLVYRLRRIFTEELKSPEMAAGIVFTPGGYMWRKAETCWLDLDDFEQGCRQGMALAREDPAAAVAVLRKALDLYKGDLLPGCSYRDWVLPARSHFQRVYLQGVLRLAELLKEERRYEEVIELCQGAMVIEYYNEELHRCYLEALLAMGRKKQARAHYSEATAAFYRDMGVKPSEELRRLYARAEKNEEFVLDLHRLQEELKERRAAKGAYLCDPEVFRYFYRLERNRQERNGKSAFLGLLSVVQRDRTPPLPKTLAKIMACLEDVLVANLRKGDLVCRWNEAQFIVLLPGLEDSSAERVLQRLERLFLERCQGGNVVLHKQSQPLLPLEESG